MECLEFAIFKFIKLILPFNKLHHCMDFAQRSRRRKQHHCLRCPTFSCPTGELWGSQGVIHIQEPVKKYILYIKQFQTILTDRFFCTLIIGFSASAVCQMTPNFKVKDQVYFGKALPGDPPAPREWESVELGGEGTREKSHGLSKGGDLNTL